MAALTLTAHLVLPPVPGAVHSACGVIGGALTKWGYTSHVSTLKATLTDLVSDALVLADGKDDLGVTLTASGGRVTVAVQVGRNLPVITEVSRDTAEVNLIAAPLRPVAATH